MAIRTNNDAKGLHNRWMRAGKAVTLTVYRLSQLLFKEASMLPVQIKLVSYNKLIRRGARPQDQDREGLTPIDFINLNLTRQKLL